MRSSAASSSADSSVISALSTKSSGGSKLSVSQEPLELPLELVARPFGSGFHPPLATFPTMFVDVAPAGVRGLRRGAVGRGVSDAPSMGTSAPSPVSDRT